MESAGVGEGNCITSHSEESSDDSDHGQGATDQLQRKKAKRFTAQQLASLTSLYKNGMQGVRQQYAVFIEHACEDIAFTTEQVQMKGK